MKEKEISRFLLGTFWTGWRRWAAWSICISAIFLLGALRSTTYADFTFASLMILPVLAMAWIAGKRNGLLVAFLAAGVWGMADMASGQPFSASWVPWANAVIRLMSFSLVALLAAQVYLQFEKQHLHATRDALTGLLNRPAFLDAGAAEVERAKRHAHPLSVIFLDLDDFKQLNDSKGHDAGDAALRATAKALRSALRSSDRVARMGGDEFAVLLPEVDYDATVEAGEKISVAVNAALKDFPPVKGSIGMAWFEKADRSFSAMLKAADGLMYEAKESEKNDIRPRRFAATNRRTPAVK